MPLHIICLVLFAALLHASWNAMLRGGADRLWSMTIMCMAIALASVIVATLLPPPARASWFCVGLSAVLHVGYNLFLVRSYKSGDLGQTYPIARGVSPILIVLAASLFAGERVAPSGLLGIALVSTGIISLA
ncbi:EamA family transporter, partial [Pseudomonas palleroniana]